MMTLARLGLATLALGACSSGDPCGDSMRQPGRVCIDWERPAQTYLGFAPNVLDVDDIDGDGVRDVVAASERGSVSVVWGSPAGLGAAATTWSIGQEISGLAVADLDGDGHLDIAAAVPGSDAIGLLSGQGGREFASVRLIASGGTRPRTLLAAQLDGGGSHELVALHDDGTLTVLRELNAGLPIAVGLGARALAAADLDADGDVDLAVALAGRHALQVMFGDGRGGFSPGPLHSVGAAPLAVVAADLDTDGAVDLASADALDDTVTILFGDGVGGLRDRAIWPTGRDPRALVTTIEDNVPVLYTLSSRTSSIQRISPQSGPTRVGSVGSPVDALVAADLDGDLVDELFVASASQGELDLLREAIGLTAMESFLGPRANAAFVVDLDGDGFDELAFITADTTDNELGASHLQFVRADSSSVLVLDTGLSSSVQHVRAADVTGDGLRDLILIGSGEFVAHVQRDDGTYEPGLSYSQLGSSAATLTVGDVDGDGAHDLILATAAGLRTARLLGLSFTEQGDPKLLFERELDGTASSLMPVDRDGDGAIDVLALINSSPVLFPDVASGSEPIPVDRIGLGNVYSIAFAGSSATDAWMCTSFGTILVADLLGPAQAVTERLDDVACDEVSLVDLDGDDQQDMLVRRADEKDGAWRVVLTPWTHPADSWTPLGPLSIAADTVRSFSLARLSLDGPDLLLDIAGEPVRAAKLSLGPAYASTAQFTGFQAFRLVDVDGDGKHDVLTTGRTLGVALGDGNGGFGPHRQHAVASQIPGAESVTQTVLSDFDADGRDDVLVNVRRAGWSAELHALNFEPDGNLRSRHLGELPGGLITLLPADIDSDGDRDLFGVVRATPLRTALWLGGVGGDLADPKWTELPQDGHSPSSSYRFADLDRDSRLDLVGLSPTDGIRVHSGLGDGAFTASRLWSPLRFLSSISFGDLDLDGRLDLAGIRTGRLIVTRGGEGSAEQPEVWLTDVRAATIAELDGDGRPELLALSPSSAVVNTDTTVVIVRRDDTGRTSHGRHRVPGPAPSTIHVADLDGDDVPDLALLGDGQITVFMQRP